MEFCVLSNFPAGTKVPVEASGVEEKFMTEGSKTFQFDVNSSSKKTFEDLKCELMLEKAHKKFIRRMLGLNTKSSIDAIYGDTGRYPLYIEIIKRTINY